MENIKYRMYCETEQQYKYETLSDTDPIPTACPDNAAHSIKEGSLTIVQRTLVNYANLEIPIYDSTTPYKGVSALATPQTLAKIYCPGTYQGKVPTAIKAICSCSNELLVGSLKIYDRLNNQVIAENANIGFVSADRDTLVDLGAISNFPVNPTSLEIIAEKVSGDGEFRVSNVVLECVD